MSKPSQKRKQNKKQKLRQLTIFDQKYIESENLIAQGKTAFIGMRVYPAIIPLKKLEPKYKGKN
jgi:hypothetical protein